MSTYWKPRCACRIPNPMPHDRVDAVVEQLQDLDVHDAVVFRATDLTDLPGGRSRLASAWDLDTLASGYEDYVDRYGPLAERAARGEVRPAEALVASTGALLWLTGDGGSPDGHVVGIANHTDFLRSVSGGVLTATGVPVHRGRTLQLWEVDIVDDRDSRVAHGSVRLMNRV